MGLKLKKMTEFVGPAPDNYTPSDSLTKPQPQRSINYDANRTDFSKSITGKRVGPGVYEVQTDEKLNLGKIGKGPKFGPNKNKNVKIFLFSLDQDHTKFPPLLENCQSTAQGQRN